MFTSHFSMVDLGALVFAIVIALLITFYLMDFSGNKGSSLPGLKPRDAGTGNLADIGDAGSLQQFLVKLHKDYGPLASFWWGEQQVVSLASPSMWKEIQGLFDRPVLLFKLFEPLFTKYSMNYANGPVGRKRHRLLTKSFGHEFLPHYCGYSMKITEDVLKEWESIGPEEHVAILDKCYQMTFKIMMLSSLGPFFRDDENGKMFIQAYSACWEEMEQRINGEIPEEGSKRDLLLKQNIEHMKSFTKSAIEERKKIKPEEDQKILIDRMLEDGYLEDVLFADLMTMLVAGIHTSGLLLTWSIYFMAKHPEVQERVYQELKDVLNEEQVSLDVLKQLRYLKQVLDETLRCAVIAPWAARYSDFDLKIEQYKIPKETPMIIALGVVHQDPKIWPEPQRFDPDRFEPEEMKKKKPLTFEPFGFAGKRQCPGYKFSYAKVTVILSILMRRFKFHIVEGQDIHFVHGLVTKPDKDIFITLSKRK